MASFMAPKMHSGVLGPQVGIYSVPGNSREFLSRFPSAFFSRTFSLPKALLSVGLVLLCARGIRGAGMAGPWLPGMVPMTWALLPGGLEVGVEPACTQKALFAGGHP